MQEKMYISELTSKVEFLFKNKIISKDTHEKFMDLAKIGDFEALDRNLEQIFIHNNLESELSNHHLIKDKNDEEIATIPLDFTELRNSSSGRIKLRQLQLENDKKELMSRVSKLLNQLNLNEIKYEYTKSEFDKLKSEYEKLENQYKNITSEVRQKKIDEEIPHYVEDVSGKLEEDDRFFTNMARNWSIIGVSVTLFAVLAAFCTFTQGTDLLIKNPSLDIIGLLYIFIRGTLGIGLLSWLAYVCFSNSRNYTHESIRRKDRQHALSFGRLFLQIYGSSATKEDAMLVFKDWNMSGDSAFSKGESTPPSVIEILKSIIPSANKNKGLDNEGK